jgi:hypothetical protein
LPQLTIKASKTGNGTIDPEGDVLVDYGADQSFTMTANPDPLQNVLVDGSPVGAVSPYEFTNVIVDHEIEAVF